MPEKLPPPELKPKVDLQKCAKEVLSLVEAEKFNLVDYGVTELQLFCKPDNPKTPELNAFRAQWEKFLDYCDAVTGPSAENYPVDLRKKYDTMTHEIGELANKEDVFWDKLRETIVPLYDKSGQYDYWKGRWKAVLVEYDVMGMTVITTKKMVNKETGEVKSSKKIRNTEMPPGFVISIL